MRSESAVVITFVLAHVIGAAGASLDRSDAITGADTVLRVGRNDPVTRHNLDLLVSRSPTGRDLVARIERLPATTIVVRARPYLMRDIGLPGRGRFRVSRDRFQGTVEYQAEPAGNHQAARVLAHELAHVLEVGLARERRHASASATLTFACTAEEGPVATGIPLPAGETEFATVVGRQVWRELGTRDPRTSVLDILARATGVILGEPPTGSTW